MASYMPLYTFRSKRGEKVKSNILDIGKTTFLNEDMEVFVGLATTKIDLLAIVKHYYNMKISLP
jgi:hypothetical protein